MLMALWKGALRWLEAHRGRAGLRALRDQDERTFADIGLRRGELTRVLDATMPDSALDFAYRDSARLRATYAVH